MLYFTVRYSLILRDAALEILEKGHAILQPSSTRNRCYYWSSSEREWASWKHIDFLGTVACRSNLLFL